MGCAPSKLDDLPPVALCRDRVKYLDQALRQAQALADAHVAYSECLRTLGPSLTRFFDIGLLEHDSSTSPTSASMSGSGSGSGSGHIQFSSDSETEDVADKQSDESRPLSHGGLSSSGVVLTSHFAKTPPPPPSPISSTWDFLNLFDDMYEKYESVYAINSEAITDRNEKIDVCVKNDAQNVEEEEQKSEPTEKKTQSENSSTEERLEVKKGVVEAMTELQVQFEKASQSGNEVLKLLSHNHHHKINSVHPECGFDQVDSAMSLQSLAHTLETLLLWEKKLYDEVKAEELLRLTHEKKTRMLEQFDKKGGDSPKVDTIHNSLSSLLTKMKVAIQIVDRISITINKLRDEELWPQIIELINRLLAMWKAMLECHKLQNQAIAEAKGLDVIASKIKYSNDDHLETVIQLKIELQNWSLCFSNWIITQKGCVKALNSWLLRCLLYEPEESEDGAVPFSPGRMGAPPVFVICNQWSRTMDRLSEKEVIEAIQGFQTSIDLILEQQKVELQQRLIENKDLGRKVKYFEEQHQKMQKVMQAGRGKKFGLLGEEVRAVLPGEKLQGPSKDDNSSRNVHGDLKQTLEAMDKFMTNSMETYEELHAHIEVVQHAAS
ncbi:protein ALTERED PHOSPHATE STARVATION RESPONSE 1-like [Argentina anserina]|uniref:protein ALTERED PHOSPHATE STARVATION RESPONSE 1-like n=1 Tax=Argentina anserina TaxID=57926 RepID=UPI0021765FF3|nr:protein ALTERED PHOSPHATE STARVATION RESPONSE 1-like [Potentilla anserina]